MFIGARNEASIHEAADMRPELEAWCRDAAHVPSGKNDLQEASMNRTVIASPNAPARRAVLAGRGDGWLAIVMAFRDRRTTREAHPATLAECVDPLSALKARALAPQFAGPAVEERAWAVRRSARLHARRPRIERAQRMR
jgi:hypothetical protein